MNIIPELHLNKNLKDARNGCIINANNMAVDEDTGFIRIDNSIYENEDLNNLLGIGDSKIIHVCPTQTEIIFFVKHPTDDNHLTLLRYNEVTKQVSEYGDIDYNGGEFVTTFTYNKGHLIISIAEYNCSNGQKVPLRVIDLDDVEHSQSPVEGQSNPYHSICPEVTIPNIECIPTRGTTYKGWHFIFIRYKISENNYTQWFNTNASIFMDDVVETYIENYKISRDNNIQRENSNNFTELNYYEDEVKFFISDNLEICNNSFNYVIRNLDKNYKYYQLGYIIISKTYSKAYRTNDIDINDTKNLFNLKELVADSNENLIKSYFNYYNVKTLDTYNNQLYIGNFEESSDNINIKDVKLSFNVNVVENKYTIDDYKVEINEYVDLQKRFDVTLIQYMTNVTVYNEARYDNEGYTILPLRYTFIGKIINGNIYNNTVKLFNLSYINPNLTIEYYDTNGLLQTKEIDVRQCYLRISNTNNNTLNPAICIKNDDSDKYEYIIEAALNSNIKIIKELNSPYDSENIYFITAYTNYHYKHFDASNSVDEFKYKFSDNIMLKSINSNCIASGEWYNFYIHFINKYGEITRGYNIFDTQITNISTGDTANKFAGKIHINDNKLVYIPYLINPSTEQVSCTINVSTLPNGYIGAYISYEKVEPFIKFKGIGTYDDTEKIFNFYNDYIYSFDKIYFDFDKLIVFKCTENINIDIIKNQTLNHEQKLLQIKSFIGDADIITKQLLLPDTYNNLNQNGRIELKIALSDELNENIQNGQFYIAYLVNTKNVQKVFNGLNKTLIPCSDILYKINNNPITFNINTRNKFTSIGHSLLFRGKYIWNEGVKAFTNIPLRQSNSAEVKNVVYPFIDFIFIDDFPIPNESLSLNNKPVVKVFPIDGLGKDVDENKKSFIPGFITELKNFVDLYKQSQVSYIDLYPKPNYNFDEENIDYIFNKTIRRSNVIQDESKHIGWRFFETENYKNINENKGNIVKLVGVGNKFLVHTEHSIFQFNADNTIKATEGDIALASRNIWDIDYRELTSSKLGHYGLFHEQDSILGSFGYIFYDRIENKFYRFDNNSFGQIDEKINQFIKLINKDVSNYKDSFKNIKFINDELRNRLFIIINYVHTLKIEGFEPQDKNIILSYNYKTNSFISLHEHDFVIGYNTKSTLYLLNEDLNSISHIDKYVFGKGLSTQFVTILINDSFDIVKCIDSITYKINKYDNAVEDIVGYFNKNKDEYYSGDKLRIYTDLCSTGQINIHYDYNDKNDKINEIERYNKPYYNLGNWNFNLIRDRIANYIANRLNTNEITRIFGNWFAVTFYFTDTENEDKIDIEFLDYKLSQVK